MKTTTQTYPQAFNGSVPRNRLSRFHWTGEIRPPRKGEWFLSGAIVEAYQAGNDINTAYHIARRDGATARYKRLRARRVTK